MGASKSKSVSPSPTPRGGSPDVSKPVAATAPSLLTRAESVKKEDADGLTRVDSFVGTCLTMGDDCTTSRPVGASETVGLLIALLEEEVVEEFEQGQSGVSVETFDGLTAISGDAIALLAVTGSTSLSWVRTELQSGRYGDRVPRNFVFVDDDDNDVPLSAEQDALAVAYLPTLRLQPTRGEEHAGADCLGADAMEKKDIAGSGVLILLQRPLGFAATSKVLPSP
eukprot:PLAT4200.1.p1 GENE.PLAT4200.1~~PLAT4200.1.p1  ORF type:complete len:244 (+),score=53.20 PLAT4200.1:58-732(+)